MREPPHLRHRRPSLPLITELAPGHRGLIERHLQSLSASDRRLRFGICMTDEALHRYVHSIPFDRDTVFGAFDAGPKLLGVVHVGFDPQRAELGLTVDPRARRMGIGAKLLRRAAVHAQARGASRMVMYYLPENTALHALAARADMGFEVEGGEPMATLTLPEPSTEAWLAEAVDAALTALDLGFRFARQETGGAPSVTARAATTRKDPAELVTSV